MSLIAAHGGEFVNRLVTGADRERQLAAAASLPAHVLNERELSDLDMIASGGLSPLRGFMGRKDYESVVSKMRLANGLPWSIPITLSATEAEAATFTEGKDVRLTDSAGQTLAILHLQEKYPANKALEASEVYRTTDNTHPGVAAMMETGPIYLGGDVTVLNRVTYNDFLNYRLDPIQTRQAFQERGWSTIVGFQTRNPIHRAHEFITKCALEVVDGLLIHPLVGATKQDDIPAAVRMKCYETLIQNYYNPANTMLAVLPAAMRYAGPREAIHHAIMRQNYGCTHFIVGRDHAGVGNYYGTYDAQKMFNVYAPGELLIQPLKFENSFWCNKNGSMATNKTSNSKPEERFNLSGTKVREMLRNGEIPPAEFTRPEVAKILIESMKNA